jgi:hypothetical protein
MRARKAKESTSFKMLVDTKGLQEILCAGRPAAVKSGRLPDQVMNVIQV